MPHGIHHRKIWTPLAHPPPSHARPTAHAPSSPPFCPLASRLRPSLAPPPHRHPPPLPLLGYAQGPPPVYPAVTGLCDEQIWLLGGRRLSTQLFTKAAVCLSLSTVACTPGRTRTDGTPAAPPPLAHPPPRPHVFPRLILSPAPRPPASAPWPPAYFAVVGLCVRTPSRLPHRCWVMRGTNLGYWAGGGCQPNFVHKLLFAYLCRLSHALLAAPGQIRRPEPPRRSPTRPPRPHLLPRLITSPATIVGLLLGYARDKSWLLGGRRPSTHFFTKAAVCISLSIVACTPGRTRTDRTPVYPCTLLSKGVRQSFFPRGGVGWGWVGLGGVGRREIEI